MNKKNKTWYMLVSCTERNFCPPQFFTSIKKARKKMKEELLEQIESFAKHEKDDEYGLDNDSAWANVHVNSDWAIYKLIINEKGYIKTV